MFVLYLMFIVVLFISSRVFKSEKRVLIISAILVSIFASVSVSNGILETIINFSRFYFGEPFLSILLLLVTTTLISEMLLRLGIINVIKSKFDNQFGLMLLLLLVPTIKVNHKYKLLKVVNVLSSRNILLFSMIVTLISNFDPFFLFALVFLNFFVIVYFMLSYRSLKIDNVLIKKPSYDDLTFINFDLKFWLFRVICYLIFILLLIFSTVVNPIFLLSLLSVMILLDLVVALEIKIYRNSSINEIELLRNLDKSIAIISNDIGYLFSVTMYILFISDWISVSSFWSTNDATMLLLVMLGIWILLFSFGSSFEFSVALVIPILAVINWNLVSHISQYTLLFLMISMFGCISVIKSNNIVNGSLILISGLLCYILFLYSNSLLLTYFIVSIVCVLIYLVKSKNAKS